MKLEDELKEALTKKEVITGSREVLKKAKTGKLRVIITSKNCPETTKKDLQHYKNIAEIRVEEFNGTSRQLGTFCGKPFSIAVLAIK